MRSCGCPAHQALLQNSCVQCADLNLDCAAPGSSALTARPQQGFARLGNKTRAFECLPPQERCNASGQDHSSLSPCAEGYIGVMCMDCDSNFYAAGSSCKECQDYDLEFPNPRLFAPVIMMVVVVVALWLWRRRHTEPAEEVRCKSCFTEFKEQMQAQGPILLQHCRWAMSTLLFCVLHFSESFYTSFLILRFYSFFQSLFRNSKANFGEFLQPCERPLMPHLPGRSHTLRPFSSHSRVWRELWTFNASSTLGLEMHSWHHEMASCKLQIVGFYHFGLNDFECFQSLSRTSFW